MSTETAAVAPAPPSARDASRRPGLGRLTLVELRKMVDTRAGFWLLLTVVLLCGLVALVTAISAGSADQTLRQFLNFTVQPALLLLPVVGVLLVTSEWSQQTTLTTFALVPQRSRVMLAKVMAAIALAVAAFLMCLLFAVVGTAVAATDAPGAWSLSPGRAGQVLFYLATSMITGVAFGAALLSSAPAIVLYFLLPTAWSILTSLVKGLDSAGDWLDTSRTLPKLTEETLSGKQWAQVATTLLLWLALPLAIGWLRVVRSEVK